MSHPLLILQQVLQGQKAPTSGTVQSVSGALVRVRTGVGIGQYLVNGFTLSPGMTVTLGPGGVTGVSPSNSETPAYDV